MAAAEPDLTADQVVVAVDDMGREVIVIPDEVAGALVRMIDKGWREWRAEDQHGESRPLLPGSWGHRTTDLIMKTYAASPVSETLVMWPEPDQSRTLFPKPTHAERAVANRGWAVAEWRRLTPFIIGRSGWDFTTRWWAYDVRSPEHRALRPRGYPSRDERSPSTPDVLVYAG